MSLHYFKQYLVTIFVSEQLNNGLWGECLLEPVKVLVLDPVRTDTLVDHTGTVFLYSKLWESLCDHLCDTCAFILAKQLVTKLDDVVSEGVLNNFVNTKSHLINKLLFSLYSQFFNFL